MYLIQECDILTNTTTQRISTASVCGGFCLTKQSEYNLRLSGNRFCESLLLVKSRALKKELINKIINQYSGKGRSPLKLSPQISQQAGYPIKSAFHNSHNHFLILKSFLTKSIPFRVPSGVLVFDTIESGL